MAYYNRGHSPSAQRKDRSHQTLHPYRPLNPFTPSVALNIWNRRFVDHIRTFDEIGPLIAPTPVIPTGRSRHAFANISSHLHSVPPPPEPLFEYAGGHVPYATQQPPGPNYNYFMIPRLRQYLWAFFTDILPRQIYLLCLLRLPSLYYDRTNRIFQSAGLTLEEIKDMALKSMAEDHQEFQAKMLHAGFYYNPQTPNLSPVYHRLKTNWETFIDKLVMEWQTMNIISVLLVPGVLTIFQIEGAADDPITRYIAFWSLVCALISVLQGCLFLVRFSSMRKPHKAAEWALETQKHQNIFWNVWVMLAMPVLWLTWSIVAFIICIMLFLWRFGTNLPMNFTFTTRPHMELGFRIFICVVLGIGALYIILTAATLMRYGSQMDEAWTRRIEGFITAFDPQPPFPQLQTDPGNPIIGIPTQHMPVREDRFTSRYSPPPTPYHRPRSPQIVQLRPRSPPAHEHYPVTRVRRPSRSPQRPQLVQAVSAPIFPPSPRIPTPPPRRRQFMREAPRPASYPVLPLRTPSLASPRSSSTLEHHLVLSARPRSRSRSSSSHERHQLPVIRPRSPSLTRPQFVQEAPQSPHIRRFSPVPVQPQPRSPSLPQFMLSESPEHLPRPQRYRSSTSHTHNQPSSPHHRQHPHSQAPSDGPSPPHSRRVPPSETSRTSSRRPRTPPHISRTSLSLLEEEGLVTGSAGGGRGDQPQRRHPPDISSTPTIPSPESEAPDIATPRRPSSRPTRHATAESVPSGLEAIPTNTAGGNTGSSHETSQ